MLSLCEKGLVCSAEHWQQDSSLEDHERPPSSKCAEPGFADFDGCLQMIIGRVEKDQVEEEARARAADDASNFELEVRQI